MQLNPWTYATREGFTLRGWHTPPTGKPLLHFLHGNGFCGRVYEPLLNLLSTDFDLWLSDVQGHGDSDHGGNFVGWRRCADLAVEALQHHSPMFGPVKKVALGHSFGGALTCLAMARHPGLFEQAVVLDPILLPQHMLWAVQITQWTGLAGRNQLARKAKERRNEWPDRDSARAYLAQRGVYKSWAAEGLQAFVDHALAQTQGQSVSLKCEPSREAEIFSTADPQLWRCLKQIQTPTHVIRAEKTFPFIKTSVAKWKSLNGVVSDEEIKGGHCFMQEDPQQAALRILSVLNTFHAG